MPLTEICNAAYSDPAPAPALQEHRLRARSPLLAIELAAAEELIGEQYKGKEPLSPT
jgi:hypothetical protein